MTTYAIRRVLQTIPILFVISVLLFIMVRSAPGGPLTAARRNPNISKEQIEANLKPELYVGRAPRQVEVFLRDVVRPVLDAHKEELGVTAEINV